MRNRPMRVVIGFFYLVLALICISLGGLGLGLFGIPAAILLAAFITFSPSYRAWLYREPGYQNRLSRLPFLNHPNPATAALAILAYFLPLSLLCMLLILRLLTESVTSFFISAGLASLGLLLLYGWAIKGWRLPFSPGQKSADLRQQEQYFHRIKRLDQVKALDPAAFENFVGALFAQMGYQVQTTGRSGDEGIDLMLYKQRRLAIVQCKRYSGSVGQPIIRDLYGAMVHNRANEAYLVTTGAFSLPARQWAANKPIHLVDGNGLLEWIETLNHAPLSASQPGQISWKQVFRELSSSLAAIGLITFALSFSMACCASFLIFIQLEQPLRQSGLWPLFPSGPGIQLPPLGQTPAPTPAGGAAGMPLVTAGDQLVNLRSGPGTEYDIVGALRPGQSLEITGRSLDAGWWQVAAPEGPAWVAARVVKTVNIDATIPVREAPPP